MAAAIVNNLSKLTAVCVDVPCCANFVKNNHNDTKEEAAKPVTTNKAFQYKKKSKFSGKASKYEDIKWAQLPLNIKKAATGLGYDKEKWDDSVLIHVDHKHWHDLTEDEKTHVTTMGWDHDAWEHQYEDKNWADLPSIVQEAATELGFTQHTWDHDHWPESLEIEWHEMSDQQRLCLSVLGYTEDTWE